MYVVRLNVSLNNCGGSDALLLKKQPHSLSGQTSIVGDIGLEHQQ